MIRPSRSCWSSIRACATRRSWAGSTRTAASGCPRYCTFRTKARSASPQQAQTAQRWATMPAGSAIATSGLRFPQRCRERRQVEYRWEVTVVCPPLATVASDPRFNGFRRNWLNILQLNPRLRVLANHAGSDSAAFCYYEYADIARYSPPLAEGLGALDLVRQSLDRVLEGVPAYGMPN